MQKEQRKKPYIAPEIVSVDFSVERGLNASVPQEAQLGDMQIGMIDEMERYLRMGDGMTQLGVGTGSNSYFGYGEYGSGGGFGTGDGGYFPRF